MAQEANSRKGKLGGLFDDLSIAQVVAGALAAVTSMLLASQIGIYGSAIGVGVGSVVSAVASQLYKKFLQRSADKLKEIHPGETLAMGSKGSAGSKDGASAGGGAGASVGAGSVAGSHAAATAKLDAAETTALPKEAARGRTPHADTSLAGGTVVQRARAERQRKKKFKRGVVIVSIVSALLAVAVSAFVIDFVSAGQGVGAKTEPILPSRSQPADDAPAASNGKDDSTGSSSPATRPRTARRIKARASRTARDRRGRAPAREPIPGRIPGRRRATGDRRTRDPARGRRTRAALPDRTARRTAAAVRAAGAATCRIRATDRAAVPAAAPAARARRRAPAVRPARPRVRERPALPERRSWRRIRLRLPSRPDVATRGILSGMTSTAYSSDAALDEGGCLRVRFAKDALRPHARFSQDAG